MTAVIAEQERKRNVANEITGLVDRINKAVRADKNLRIALVTTLAEHKSRIFSKGQASDYSQIGVYSTKPTSISKSRQANKTDKSYFPGGYSQYKRIIGKNPGYVILRDSDQMYADYGLQGSSGSYGFGFTNQFNADKSVWNEEHFDKEVFQLSQKEIDLVANVLNAQIKNDI